MQRSSAELWRKWRTDGDGAAFAALVVPELPRAVAVARGAGCDAGAAEDAVQDALVALARERSDAPLALGLDVWLFRSVRDRARSSLRAMRRRRRREEAVARDEAAPPGAPRIETAELVERALARLDDDEREAVRLRCALDLDYGQVASILGTSEGAARVRVHRALERLRARLGGDAATLLAALPLPVVVRPELLVSTALGKAAAAAAVGLATGGAAMASAKTVLGLTAAALVGGVVATWVVPALRDAPADVGTTLPEKAAETAAPAPTKPAATKRRGERAASEAPAAQPDAGLDDLAPTDAERAWLRTALVAERDRRAQATIRPEDSGSDILRRYLEVQADVEPVLASFDAARAHVKPATGPAVRIPAPDEKGSADLTAAAGASAVEFGPGRFDLRNVRGEFFDRRKPLEALEISGAGKDKTTLVVGGSQEFMLSAEARHVVFRDLTLEDPDGDATVFDVRGTASLALERVRLAGWTSAGHGAPIGIGGQAFLACRDCDFQGDGRSCVLSLRGPCLAVFERCTFADAYSALTAGGAASGGRPSLVRIIDCTFRGSRLADSRIRQSAARIDVDLRVRGGRAEFGGRDLDDAARRKQWGAEFATSIDDVAFAADAPRLTTGDLVRVLEMAAARGWDRVVHAVVLPGGRATPPRVDLYVAVRDRVERHVVEEKEGVLREIADVRQGSASVAVQNEGDVAGLLPLRVLLARQTDIGIDAVRDAGYHKGRDGWSAWASWGSQARRNIDATTGESIDRK